MSLAMSRPWKHPKTGVYWLRKRIPADLVPVLGRAEEKRSLKTKDPGEAKKRHLAALSELEVQWANLRAGPVALTEREAQAIAADLFERWLAIHHDNPSDQKLWQTDLFEKLWASPTQMDLARPLHEPDWDGVKRREMEALCFEGADDCLRRQGLRVDQKSRETLARAVAVALQRASLALARQAGGEPEPGFAWSPRSSSPIASPGSGLPALSFDEAFKLWVAEKQPREKTIYEWRRVLRQLQAFLGHGDAHRLTDHDLIRWKNSLIDANQRPKTIRDAKIAPVRAILQCAVDNRRLAANPAERIVITVRAKAAEARRDYTDDEARLVLRAALQQKDPVLRWVPWLCAYSGARVSEVCQLRREDVHQHDGIWCMRFAAEAGPLKNANSERAVPLHPALIDSGFLDYVAAIKSGPIFPDLPPDKFGKRGGNGTKVLGRFVRSLGLKDPRLAPNHSWRHRFKTMGRRHELQLDIVNAITGHGRKSVADRYGEFPMAALYREITKIPNLDVC